MIAAALAAVSGLLAGGALRVAAGRLVTGSPVPLRALLRWPRPTGALADVVTAVLAAGCVSTFGPSARAGVAAAFCLVLVLLSAIDIERRKVPNRIVIPAAVAVFVAQTALRPRIEWLVAALGAAGVLFVIALVKPGGMGMGDVKLALLLGAGLGRAVPICLVLGLLAAFIPALALVVRHGRGARDIGIPFVPYLAFGAVATLFLQAAALHPQA